MVKRLPGNLPLNLMATAEQRGVTFLSITMYTEQDIISNSCLYQVGIISPEK